jgi:hypothetical protein
MSRRHTHETSVRYLLPSTKRDIEQWQLDAAADQFYELASEYENCPTLDTLIANTKTPEQMFKQSPTLIYDSGWKSAVGTEDVKDG